MTTLKNRIKHYFAGIHYEIDIGYYCVLYGVNKGNIQDNFIPGGKVKIIFLDKIEDNIKNNSFDINKAFAILTNWFRKYNLKALISNNLLYLTGQLQDLIEREYWEKPEAKEKDFYDFHPQNFSYEINITEDYPDFVTIIQNDMLLPCEATKREFTTKFNHFQKNPKEKDLLMLNLMGVVNMANGYFCFSEDEEEEIKLPYQPEIQQQNFSFNSGKWRGF